MNPRKAGKVTVVCLLLLRVAVFASATPSRSYAAVGLMAVSPPLSDTLASFSIADTLYGGTVNYALSPWLSVGAEVLYLGDIYYGKDSGGDFFGPSSWTELKAAAPAAGAKADWEYYESLIYAPLTFSLTIPLGFLRPYLGAGPAFYFHFPSTNQDAAFDTYLAARYGAGQRMRTGFTARVGLDVYLADSFALGLGYTVREDLLPNLFEDLARELFYKENGYFFVTGRFILN
jgi:hypothetical protein